MAVSDEDLMQRYRERRRELGIDVRTGLVRITNAVMAAIERAERRRPGEHVVQRTYSPIEAVLEDLLAKYLTPATRKTAQRPVSTPFGRFRPDFYLVAPETGRVLVIECDGREYHDRLRDKWRDAAMLGCGVVHDLLRIEGKDLRRRPHDVLFLLSRLFPTLFLPRAPVVFAREASPEAHAFRFSPDGAATLYYPPPARALVSAWDDPVDDPVDDLPFTVHSEDRRAPGLYDDFLNFDLRGTSRYASEGWRFRYRALCDRSDLTLDQLVERERRTGEIG